MNKLDSDFITGVVLAWRGRCLSVIVWLVLLLLATTLLGAQFSGRQPPTIALDLGLSVIRLGLPLFIVILVQELFTREFERRYYLYSLTSPRPRYRFILGRFSALLSLSLIALLICGAILAAVTSYIAARGNMPAPSISLGWAYLVTLALIAVDLLVISSVSTLLAISATTPSFVLIGTFGFVLVARSYAGIITLLQTNSYLVANAEQYQNSLQLLSWLLPDLGALDVRGITLYGRWEFLPGNWPELLISSGFYSLCLLLLSIWVLNNKSFD